MDRIRVLVVGSWLLRDIVEQITGDHADIEVFQHVPPRAQMEEAVGETSPAVVICDGQDAPSSAEVDELLRRHPLVRILVVEKARRGSSLCELRPYQRELAELGPDALIAVIRGRPTLAGRPRTPPAGEPR